MFHRDIRLVCCLSISVVYRGPLHSVHWYAWCPLPSEQTLSQITDDTIVTASNRIRRPVNVHLSTHTWSTSLCIPIWLPVDVHLDYLLMDSCRCTHGLLVAVQLSGYLSTHIYETACSCICMRPPVNSHPQDTTPVAQRLQCESKKLHSFTFVITLSNKALSWQFWQICSWINHEHILCCL